MNAGIGELMRTASFKDKARKQRISIQPVMMETWSINL